MTNWEAYTTNVHYLNGTGGQKPASKMSAEPASAKGSGGPSLTSSSFSWLLAPLPLATRLQPLPPSHMPSSFRLSVVVFPLSPLARIPITGFKAKPKSYFEILS